MQHTDNWHREDKAPECHKCYDKGHGQLHDDGYVEMERE
jgi:hypothetical protein